MAQPWQHSGLIVFGALSAHTAICYGDFGLLSYLEYNKNKKVVTYMMLLKTRFHTFMDEWKRKN